MLSASNAAIPLLRQSGLRLLSTGSNIFDVAIVGGGLVGSALAASLSSNKWTQGLNVTVLDRQAPPQESTSLPEVPGLRVSTVTPSSAAFFRRCAAWQDIAPPRSASFSCMQVWDWGGNGFVKYTAADAGTEQIGFVAENLVLQLALLRHLARPGRPPVLQDPGTVEELILPPYSSQEGQGQGMPLAEIRTKDGRILTSKLVIGADGGRSQVREMAGLRTVGWPYNQRGLVATVRTEPENTTAHQRFLATGPIALLPVREGFSNIVWSTTPQRAHQLAAATSSEFAAAANEMSTPSCVIGCCYLFAARKLLTTKIVRFLGKALHGGTRPSTARFGPDFEPPPEILESTGPKPQSFPLVLMHAGRYVRPRLALIGDAAHSVHPLAGQGVNLGFQDVQVLTEALAHAVECGRDLGELALLEEQYERPRQRANLAMMSALDSLSRIYKPQEGFVAAARSLGLTFVNSSAAVKQQIMNYAMGL